MGSTGTKLTIALALVVTGCGAKVLTSRDVLGPEHSQSEVRLPPGDISQDIARLFTSRGYALAAQWQTGTSMKLRFKGTRRSVVGSNVAAIAAQPEAGSWFEVSITEASRGHAIVSIEGWPTLNGLPPCPPGRVIGCEVGSAMAPYVNGVAEADVVRGVLTDLASSGLVVGPGPAPAPRRALPPQMDASITCQEARERVLLLAKQAEDRNERMTRMAFVPVCP